MKKLLLFSTLTLSNFSIAETWYDDWQTETVDVTEQVQHYGGTGHCTYDQQIVELSPLGGYVTHLIPEIHQFFIHDTTDPTPTLSIYAPYQYITDTGLPFSDFANYPCTPVSPLPETYVENVVVAQREVRTPIQPFSSYALYEAASCSNYTRNGHINFGHSGSSSSNVKVRISRAGFPSQVIFNGPSNGFISFSTSTTGNYNASIKIGNGSSRYFNINVPECGPGGSESTL